MDYDQQIEQNKMSNIPKKKVSLGKKNLWQMAMDSTCEEKAHIKSLIDGLNNEMTKIMDKRKLPKRRESIVLTPAMEKELKTLTGVKKKAKGQKKKPSSTQTMTQLNQTYTIQQTTVQSPLNDLSSISNSQGTTFVSNMFPSLNDNSELTSNMYSNDIPPNQQSTWNNAAPDRAVIISDVKLQSAIDNIETQTMSYDPDHFQNANLADEARYQQISPQIEGFAEISDAFSHDPDFKTELDITFNRIESSSPVLNLDTSPMKYEPDIEYTNAWEDDNEDQPNPTFRGIENGE